MLAAEPRADFRATWFSALSPTAVPEARRRFAALGRQAVAYFGKGDTTPIRLTHRLEAR